MSRVYKNVFCAFCHSPRRIYSKKHAGWRDALYSFWLAFSLGLLIWQEVNPRFVPIWVTLFGISEIMIQLRWRLGLTCVKCGFDPLLYLRDPKAASVKVRQTLKSRLSNPNSLDKKIPVLEKLIAEKAGRKHVRLRWPEDEPSVPSALKDNRGVPNAPSIPQKQGRQLPSSL